VDEKRFLSSESFFSLGRLRCFMEENGVTSKDTSTYLNEPPDGISLKERLLKELESTASVEDLPPAPFLSEKNIGQETERIKLNVGGKVIETTVSTLISQPGSRLAKWFSGKIKERKN
jgi:hypothetical protein